MHVKAATDFSNSLSLTGGAMPCTKGQVEAMFGTVAGESALPSAPRDVPTPMPAPEAASEQGCAAGFPCYNTKGREYHKSYIGEEKSMGPVTRQFFAFLRSSTWVAFLEALSGVSGIVPDPERIGTSSLGI